MKNHNQRAPQGSSRFLEVKGLWDAWEAIGHLMEPVSPGEMRDPRITRYRVCGLVQDEEKSWWVALVAKGYRHEEVVQLSAFKHLFQEVQV